MFPSRKSPSNNAYARVVIETNQTINLLTALQSGNTNAPVNQRAPRRKKFHTQNPCACIATNEMAGSTAPKISIGSIVISNAAFRFTDLSLTPNVNLAVQQAERHD